MKKTFLALGLALMAWLSPAIAAETTPPPMLARGLDWSTDYNAALAKAKAENKKVFVFFTGSDWCGWCIRLQKEILMTAEFSQYAREKLVLVELDFPRNKPQPAAVKQQNRSLAQKMGVEGYPTVIVLNSSGKQVGKMGYQQGGPKPFIQRLSSL